MELNGHVLREKINNDFVVALGWKPGEAREAVSQGGGERQTRMHAIHGQDCGGRVGASFDYLYLNFLNIRCQIRIMPH